MVKTAIGFGRDVVLDVRNTSAVIDGGTTRVIGLPPDDVVSKPVLLPLFPDSSGQVRLSVGLPTSFPAGKHAVTIEVASVGAGLPPAYLDLDVQVSPRLEMPLEARPQLVRARREARFAIEIVNSGNLPLDVRLHAVDADRAVTPSFAPDFLRIAAGTVAVCILTIRGPRMLVGSDLDRVLTVQATGTPGAAGKPGATSASALLTGEAEDDEVEAWLSDLRGEPGSPQAPDAEALNDLQPEVAEQAITRTVTLRLRQRPSSAGGCSPP